LAVVDDNEGFNNKIHEFVSKAEGRTVTHAAMAPTFDIPSYCKATHVQLVQPQFSQLTTSPADSEFVKAMQSGPLFLAMVVFAFAVGHFTGSRQAARGRVEVLGQRYGLLEG